MDTTDSMDKNECVVICVEVVSIATIITAIASLLLGYGLVQSLLFGTIVFTTGISVLVFINHLASDTAERIQNTRNS